MNEKRSSCSRATRPGRSCWRRRCACSPPMSSDRARFSALRPVAGAAAARRRTGRPRGGRRGSRGRAGPEGRDDHARGTGDVGTPNRILREEIGGTRDRPHRPAHPRHRAARRRARADLGRPHGRRRRLRREGMARGRRRGRGRRSAPSGSSGGSAARSPSSRSGSRRANGRERLRRARSTRSARSTKGCSRRRWTRPRRAIPTCPTSRN